MSFAVSFVVIYVFWTAHGTALRRAEAVEVEPRGCASRTWVAARHRALPFATAVVGRDLNGTSAPLYIGTMVSLSALTSMIVRVVDRSVGPPRRGGWAWATTAVFAGTAFSVINADLGMFALLLLAQRPLHRSSHRPHTHSGVH